MLEDLCYAVGMLRKHPGFTLVAVLTLALGLGANSTIFTYVDAAYLRALPVSRPGELVHVTTAQKGGLYTATSYQDYLDYQRQSDVFSGLAVYGTRGALLEVDGEAQGVTVQLVSGNYFSLLGVRTLMGRILLPEDDSPSAAEPAVLISHNLWQQRFGGRADIAGQVVRLNEAGFTIAGVAPPRFRGLDRFVDVAVWIPVNLRPLMVRGDRAEVDLRQSRWLDEMVGRPRPGVTLQKAEVQLATIADRLVAAYPKTNQGWGVSVAAESERRRRAALDQGAFLMAMVGLVLLIACANVANLLLSHADSRRREIAVRLALGASRGQIVRQMLTQSAVLSLAGAAAGIALSVWLTSLLPFLMPRSALAIRADLHLDARVILFTLLMSLLAALVFGVFPALQASRPDLVPALKGESAGSADSRRRFPVRNVLVVAQVAVSLVLLGSAGLLWRSLLYSSQLRPGFDARKQMVSFFVVPGFYGYRDERLSAFYEEFRRRLQALPGVKQATYAARVPLGETGGARSQEAVIPGYELPPGTDRLRIRYTMVGPDYFNTFGTRLRRGRPVDERDTSNSPRVAVINQTMAQRFWPGEDPIGRSFLMGRDRTEVSIVGVAEDSKIRRLHEAPEPYLFVPFAQFPESEATYALETAGDPLAVLAAVKTELRGLDKAISIIGIETLSELMDRVLYDERLAAWVVGSLALLGLLLGTIGLYGVVALLTGRRTREVGIRMALGASRWDVLAMVVRQGVRLAVVGILVGLGGSLAATRLIASRLHGVSRFDPATFAAVALLLAVVAALASYAPARRASRVHPMQALRYE